MGIGRDDNMWWLDVLEWGEESPYAGFFDIDWMPAKPELRGKVLIPVLGDHYGRVLEAGELKLTFEAATGSFDVRYYDHRFPVTPGEYERILRAVLQPLPPCSLRCRRRSDRDTRCLRGSERSVSRHPRLVARPSPAVGASHRG